MGSDPEPDRDQEVLHILFLASNPIATSRLDLEEELRAVESELRAAEYRAVVTLSARHGARPDDLLRYVRAERPRIVHFSGHGSKAGIVLREDGGGTRVVSGASLRRFFDSRGVDLVVLNACFTGKQAEEIARSVRAVIGTTSSVSDEAARRFSCAFYRGIGSGLTVSEAFRDGGDAVALYGLADVFQQVGDLDWRPVQP